MAPDCVNKGTNYPHGIPCCNDHAHDIECVSWVGEDCTCGKE